MFRPDTTLPTDWTVRAGRDRYLAENGFTIEGYTAPSFKLRFLGRLWDYPNPASRQKLVPLHDLHHVATGYGTDLIGEAEIGAWEIHAGCPSPIGLFLNGSAMLVGLFIAPARVIAAWRAAKGHRSLYVNGADPERVLAMTIGEFRTLLGIPPEGQARQPRKLHPDAPVPA